MKKFIITTNGSVGFDTDTEEIFSLDSKREAISRIWIAEEPMTIIVKRYDKDYTLNAKKNDIIISFYDETFENPVIVVKSKDWVKNIETYEKKQAEYRAKCEAACGECNTCDGPKSIG